MAHIIELPGSLDSLLRKYARATNQTRNLAAQKLLTEALTAREEQHDDEAATETVPDLDADSSQTTTVGPEYFAEDYLLVADRLLRRAAAYSETTSSSDVLVGIAEAHLYMAEILTEREKK